jgi:predicted ribosomally synthesized peptide with SipW-like signal peptide
MRRLVFPILVIGLAAGMFTMGSGAFFSDTEQDTGNTIAAGTLDLSDPQATQAAGSCNVEAFAPNTNPPPVPTPPVQFDDGEYTCTVSVENVGSLTGDLWMRIDVINLVGELGAELGLAACDEITDGTLNLSSNVCPTVEPFLNDLSFVCTLVARLDSSESYAFEFGLSDGAVTNASQGASVDVDFYFEFVQVGQTASSTCGGPPYPVGE